VYRLFLPSVSTLRIAVCDYNQLRLLGWEKPVWELEIIKNHKLFEVKHG